MLGSLIVASSASAATLLDETGTVERSVERTCFERPLTARDGGVSSHRFAASEGGMLDVRLDARDGDWDLAVFNDRGGQLVAAAASAASDERSRPDSPSPARSSSPRSAGEAVVNYAATEPYEGTISYSGPDPFVPPMQEDWTLICKLGGKVRATSELYVERGERVRVDCSRS